MPDRPYLGIVFCWIGHNKNLQEKIQELKDAYEKEIVIGNKQSFENGEESVSRKYEELLQNVTMECNNKIAKKEEEIKEKLSQAYEEGKSDAEAWHNDIVRQKLEEQAAYFEEEINSAREQAKKELREEMDVAARRNEEELKLFQDYYEEKLKPFKKFIRIQETTDKKIKEIQTKINNRFKKSFGKNEGKK